MSKEDILNAIAEMSVMEVVELIEAMEEKFGVTAAAAVAAAPAVRIAAADASVNRTKDLEARPRASLPTKLWAMRKPRSIERRRNRRDDSATTNWSGKSGVAAWAWYISATTTSSGNRSPSRVSSRVFLITAGPSSALNKKR